MEVRSDSFDRTLAEWRYEAPTRAAEILRSRLRPDSTELLREFAAVLASIQTDGLWEIIEISDAQPYLPENAEFADRIMVHYVTCTIH